jgi:pilus assembly protein CpaE
MPASIPVVIIDSDADSAKAIQKHLKNLGNGNVSVEGVATNFESGYEMIHRKRPVAVIMELQDDLKTSIERIGTVLKRFPQLSILATSSDKSSDTILQVMRAGAAEYILRPVSEMDLASALQKVGRLWITKPSPEEEVGKVYTVFSPKGGMGVTTIAINLAVNLYNLKKKPTVVVDLDLAAGDVSTFLNLTPSYTISDVTVNISRLDKSFLQGVIAKHESGIYVLAEPQKVEDSISISASDLRRVLGLIKTMFDYIIIDTEAALDDRTMTALEISDMVLLPFVLSLPSIKHTKRYLSYFEEAGFGRERLKLVVNRQIKKGDIKAEDAEKFLRYPIFWSIPNDYEAVVSCINKGVPVSVGAPRSHVSDSIKGLAEAVVSAKVKGGG